VKYHFQNRTEGISKGNYNAIKLPEHFAKARKNKLNIANY